jgi:hypothetical protein
MSEKRLFLLKPAPRSAGWLLTGVFLLALVARAPAQDQRFQEMVNQLPRSANTVVLLNMEKLKQSPMGVREGWAAKLEKAFEEGLFRVPPQATRFVLAADMDFEFMEPVWEAAVMDSDTEISMEQIAKNRGGVLDTIEGLPAVALPNDTYVVQFGPKTLGAMGPGKRQAVVRWIREVRGPSPPRMSGYLEKLASYSDKAGSEIILGMDLQGALALERVVAKLKENQPLLDQWKADLPALAKLLAGVHGVRVGVRIGEQPTGMIAVDFRGDASITQAYAKPLILQVLANQGASIADLETWTAKAEGSEISLSGTFTTDGLRRLLSVVDSPAPAQTAAAPAPEQVSPGDLPKLRVQASLDHFHAVTAMANDLKKDMKGLANLASSALFFDKYAKKIERLPILNVDEDLLNYSAFVASQLRDAAGSVRGMGIQSGARESQIISSSAGYGYVGGYRYGAYGSYGGAYSVYSPRAEARGIEAERRVVRSQEKGNMAMNVQQIRDGIIAATADVRRKMTQKYQVEF